MWRMIYRNGDWLETGLFPQKKNLSLEATIASLSRILWFINYKLGNWLLLETKNELVRLVSSPFLKTNSFFLKKNRTGPKPPARAAI
jgi:hypothetical protein